MTNKLQDMKKQLLLISALAHVLMAPFVYAGLPNKPLNKANIPGTTTTDAETQEKARQWLQAQPVRFLENKGQMTDMGENPVPFVLFKAEAPGLDMYITEKGLTYVFISRSPSPDLSPDGRGEGQYENAPSTYNEQEPSPPHMGEMEGASWSRIDMDLPGASIKKENIIKEGMSKSFFQYFFSHCPDGITDVRTYQKVTIKDIYPGIDWVFYNSSKEGFKYDFIVHPGADPTQIALVYSSVNPIQLNKEGNLNIKTERGTLRENAPYSYIKETNKEVKSKFEITDQQSINNVYYQTTIHFKFPRRVAR